MGTIKRHPLYATADALKRALILNGYSLFDDGVSPELEDAAWEFPVYQTPKPVDFRPILLEGNTYMLRSGLLAPFLGKLRGTLPIRQILCGRVYDRSDASHPCHTVIEGVLASKSITKKEFERLWNRIAQQLYGICASAALTELSSSACQIKVRTSADTFVLAYAGAATAVAKTLLGTDQPEVDTWIFSIDVDAVAMHDYQLPDRDALYDPTMTFLAQYDGDFPVLGDSFAARAANLLRAHGFLEFSGLKLYESDCYRKMNMVQESWDSNNKGIQLARPLGAYTGLPTVLTPAIEEALTANYRAGVESARLFEIGHIFLPASGSGRPTEKLALSIGAYGADMDKASFRKWVDRFLTELGIRNHFFIPTDLAIAYNTSDCWLVLDERMRYLETNFGSISQKALDNHGLGVQAYMLQIELSPLEKKAAEEFAFIPTELS